MRETTLLIEKPKLPNATEIKKLEHKSLVSTIYIGKSRDKRITGDIIQANDKLIKVNEIVNFIYSEQAKLKEDEIKYMTTSLKADIKANVGTILDIKKELIDINALKINFSTQGSDLSKNQ